MRQKQTITRAEAYLTCSDKDCLHGTKLEYRVTGLTQSIKVKDHYTCEKCGKRAHGEVQFEVKRYG